MSLERAAAVHLPFAGGRFRLAMGLQPVEEYAWFDLGQNLSCVLDAKRALLDSRHSEVFQALPAADMAASELLCLLAEHLSRYHAALFRKDGDQLANLVSGEIWNIAEPPLHPLDLAGRLVAEDLCLLQSRESNLVLVGASLCAPSRWVLAEKIGQPVRAVHAPVPGYDGALGQPVDQFLAALKPGRLFRRFNWGIADDPTPFQPMAAAPARDITAANAGEKLWLRVEQQTFRRLPETAAILFAIRTTITRLDQAIQSGTGAGDLAAAIREMPPAMQDYKRITPLAAPLLSWLEAKAKG